MNLAENDQYDVPKLSYLLENLVFRNPNTDHEIMYRGSTINAFKNTADAVHVGSVATWRYAVNPLDHKIYSALVESHCYVDTQSIFTNVVLNLREPSMMKTVERVYRLEAAKNHIIGKVNDNILMVSMHHSMPLVKQVNDDQLEFLMVYDQGIQSISRLIIGKYGFSIKLDRLNVENQNTRKSFMAANFFFIMNALQTGLISTLPYSN